MSREGIIRHLPLGRSQHGFMASRINIGATRIRDCSAIGVAGT